MQNLEMHKVLGAEFKDFAGAPVPVHYGDPVGEHRVLIETAGIGDLSTRGRICVTGTDRVRFLHGQVTNDVQSLRPGQGCYAAVVSPKGKLQSDLNLHCLEGEILLDFEPGLSRQLAERLERFIVADDVQIVDVAPMYGLLTIQGPVASSLLRSAGVADRVPEKPFTSARSADGIHGESYVINQPRLGTIGFDLFLPAPAVPVVLEKLVAAAKTCGGRICGWQAFEDARIEAGIPRFGVDMDETNFPQECGIEDRAVSYEKGCYIGQEVLNRLHTRGHVNWRLGGLLLTDGLQALPVKGDKLFAGTVEVGRITSAARSPSLQGNIALAYLKAGHHGSGTELRLVSASGQSVARVVPLPFSRSSIGRL